MPIKLLGMLCDGFSVQKHWPQVISIWNHRNYNYVLGLPIKLGTESASPSAAHGENEECLVAERITTRISLVPQVLHDEPSSSIIIAHKKRISASREQQKRTISTHKFMLESCDKSDESHHTQLVPVQAIELENFLSLFCCCPTRDKKNRLHKFRKLKIRPVVAVQGSAWIFSRSSESNGGN